jgi:hypothetical protein
MVGKENIVQQKSNKLLEEALELCKILAKIKISMKKDN